MGISMTEQGMAGKISLKDLREFQPFQCRTTWNFPDYRYATWKKQRKEKRVWSCMRP